MPPRPPTSELRQLLACLSKELEETARLTLLTHGMRPRILAEAEVRELVAHFDVDWED